MKQRELDDLFRRKLEAYGKVPSEDAWNKIESEIRPDKVTWRFYVGIAASILLVAVISILIFLPDSGKYSKKRKQIHLRSTILLNNWIWG